MKESKQKGGKREGAGRPQVGEKRIFIRVSEEESSMFKALGGSLWARRAIREEYNKLQHK